MDENITFRCLVIVEKINRSFKRQTRVYVRLCGSTGQSPCVRAWRAAA